MYRDSPMDGKDNIIITKVESGQRRVKQDYRQRQEFIKKQLAMKSSPTPPPPPPGLPPQRRDRVIGQVDDKIVVKVDNMKREIIDLDKINDHHELNLDRNHRFNRDDQRPAPERDHRGEFIDRRVDTPDHSMDVRDHRTEGLELRGDTPDHRREGSVNRGEGHESRGSSFDRQIINMYSGRNAIDFPTLPRLPLPQVTPEEEFDSDSPYR